MSVSAQNPITEAEDGLGAMPTFFNIICLHVNFILSMQLTPVCLKQQPDGRVKQFIAPQFMCFQAAIMRVLVNDIAKMQISS